MRGAHCKVDFALSGLVAVNCYILNSAESAQSQCELATPLAYFQGTKTTHIEG